MEDSFAENLREGIAYLRTNPVISGERYPQYTGEEMLILGLLKPDYDYLKHHSEIENKPIEEMTEADLATMFTFILRGERFSDGHIAYYIENGALLALAERLAVLRGIDIS